MKSAIQKIVSSAVIASAFAVSTANAQEISPDSVLKPQVVKAAVVLEQAGQRGFQADIRFDQSKFSVASLDNCLELLPEKFQGALASCTNPRPGLVRVAVAYIGDDSATLPAGPIGEVAFALNADLDARLFDELTPSTQTNKSGSGISLTNVETFSADASAKSGRVTKTSGVSVVRL